MCGIGGILRTDGEPIPEEWLDAIDARIAYRGPDGHGRFRDSVEVETENGKKKVEVAMVHRRLSIIDHEGGAQPMVSERGRNDNECLVAVVFNGCIYNHRELRKELETTGHTFVTDHSDTEVLIHGWREWKEEIIDHLEGMYAFAIWDRTSAGLTLARDEFGEKPLYFNTDSHITTFANVLSAINQAPRLSQRDVQKYLQLGYLSNDSVVKQLQPGSALGINSNSKPQVTDLQPFSWSTESIDPGGVEKLLKEAVQRRLDADVPLGCFLSGGVDSSLVAHFAREVQPDLMTFCVRMPDPRYDESNYAESVARTIGTRHTTLEVEMHPADDLIQLIEILGQPFGDSSVLPTYWVSKAVRNHAKVALSGDGGDELFIGYERFLAARHLARHWKWLRRLPNRLLLRAHPKSKLHKLGRLIQAAADYEDFELLSLESLFSVKCLEKLIDFQDGDAVWIGMDNEHDGLQAMRKGDIENYLPDDLLRKVDTASMACGLEVRCPFLDRELAWAVLSAPIEQLMPKGQRKGLLRQIARKYLPREIVDRPKMGFAIPIGEWFRTDCGGMKTLLLDHLNSAEPFGPIELNRKAVQRFIEEHMSGKRDHGHRLFTLLTLSIWARKFTPPEGDG